MTAPMNQPVSPGSPGPTGNRGTFARGTFARGTLGRQLLVRVLLIVAAIAVLLSGASTLAVSRQLINNADRQLSAIVDRLRAPGAGFQTADALLRGGQPIGTLYAAYVAGSGAEADSGRLASTNGPQVIKAALPDSVLAELSGVSPDDGPTTIRLTGLGRYRVAAYPAVFNDNQQGTLVVGIPLSDTDRVLSRTVLVAITVSLLALIGAGVAVQEVVRRSLRPLNRVAATAQQVSQLRLDRGDVTLALRVPESDADPVSEVGRVGQAFNHMLDNVDRALAARQASETKLKQFIADASHELRNPLASIRGYAELTRRERDRLPIDTAYALGRVESEAERMSSLVEDLLLLARLDSGPAIDVGPVDVTELLINAISDARAAGPDHHWSLELGSLDQGNHPPAVVIGDRNRLHQAVVNLLANARTHTPAGTAVRAGLRVEGSEVVISVNDNGPGIPAEVQGRVFERFTRGDDSRTRTGDGGRSSTGLGLAIVAAVAEAHHGMVRVWSVPGDTRFELRLPLAPGPSAT